MGRKRYAGGVGSTVGRVRARLVWAAAATATWVAAGGAQAQRRPLPSLGVSAADAGAAETTAAETTAAETTAGAIDTGAIDTGAIDASAIDVGSAAPEAASPARALGNPMASGSAQLDSALPSPGPAADVPSLRYPIPTRDRLSPRADEPPRVRIPSRITARLRALDAHLQALAARGGGSAVNAVLSLLTGGLTVTLGILFNNDLSIYLYLYGGVAAGRGVMDLLLSSDPSGAALTYQMMPMDSVDEVRQRLEYGEDALHGLAERAMTARTLDGAFNLAAGVAVIPVYLAPRGFEITDGDLSWFVLLGAGISAISGIVTLASTSAAERRWSEYEQLRRRLQEERRQERDAVDGEAQARLPNRGSSLRVEVSPTSIRGVF